MSTLHAVQRGFQAYVLGEAEAPPATVAGTGMATAGERLRVYAEAIRLRFLEVLGESYPGLHGLLGDDAFARLARAYATAHPSHHPSIRWLGRHLPDFVRTTAPWRAHPVLTEMASFEWSKGELVDAADSPVVSLADVAAIPGERWAGIRPRPKPAARRLALGTNTPAIWGAIDRGEVPPPLVIAARAVEWLLWRQGVSVHWRSIEPDEAWALQVGAEGGDFGAICSGLADRIGPDRAALRAATCLKQWVTDGLLEAI